jgi:hypothetical protein
MAELEPYRVLVTGSRDWASPLEVYERLADVRAVVHESGRYDRFVVVHGACPRGADKHAARWCLFPDAFADMPVIGEPHPADWNGGYGKTAGFVRNAKMVKLGADLCLAFIRNGSRGATHCADLAEKAGIPVRRFTEDET